MLFYLIQIAVYAQSAKDIIVEESYNGRVFSEFLEEIEEKHNIDLIFDTGRMQALTVTGITGRERLLEYLQRYLIHYNITRVKDNIVFITTKSESDEFELSKNDYFVIATPKSATTTIHGKLIDSSNGEAIIGAQVLVTELNKGTLTDANGEFSFQLSPRIYHIEIKYIGYQTNQYILGFSSHGTSNRIEVDLFPESKQLESVIVTAQRADANVMNELTGVESLSITTIKSMPTFMGEVDPVRSLTTLPGVSTVGELSSGFNVRGGEAGQNLILQDGAPIYNPSHLFGFFSAFNPDMVSDVVLYKGGGPANFGGRISSVLDIDLRNGDVGKHTLTGGIGLVSSRLSVEGPLMNEKSSYIVGGRISYTNWLINSSQNLELKNSNAKFYDITAKVFTTLNENNFISLSVYNSYDDFKLALTDSTFSWGTMNISARWDHVFNDRLSSSLNIFNSNYFSQINSTNPLETFVYANGINTTGLKYDLVYNKSENLKLVGGLELNRIIVEPGELNPHESTLPPQDISDQHEIEGALYIQGDFKLSPKWSVSAGLRYSHFFRLGPDNIYVYDFTNINGRYPVVTDTANYSSGEIIKQYGGFEPRISLRYLLQENTSIKASYYRGYQYLHLISNTTSATPQDYYVTSGPYLKPEIGDQFSLGVFKNFKNNKFELSVEGFYKEIANTVDYIEGADITLNPILEAGLVQGDGLAYGVEVLLKKNSGGKINGWLSYTYSRSLRNFNSNEAFQVINEGDYYPSSFDKPHNLSLVLSYQPTERIILSANFNYSTGRPITIPISKFDYESYLVVLNYSMRNEYRIPDYHRLDISATFKDAPKKNKRWMGEWVISVFNVYGRANTYSIYFNQYGNANKISVLGTIFPSVTYNFKF